ncbi:hypothetical protein Nepgr_030285 [Nepenthes gracilis]|uniref:F-box domain-containing protein n=1 Tax=Nepenthes gracilis TaxID=150966 RepID=A0AAD3TGQ9_NEPGR|nr:hypothetical protein Nepgr_030285 [Nepenthes gracilis]
MDVIQSSLPYDVTLKIASSLPVRDVCALGSCSKFWRELCGSDCIWISLYKWRWPSLCYSSPVSDNTIKSQSSDPLFKDWRKLYIGRHNEMAGGAASVVNSVEQCSSSISLEVGDFLKAIKELCSLQLGFKDVELFLFKPELSALLNLIGLYYCIDWLEVPSDRIMEALESCKITERQVFVKWWKLGRWFFGFRKRDELQSRLVSLGDLAMAKDDELLRVLRRGAVYEVLRVQISVAQASSLPWVSSRPSIS